MTGTSGEQSSQSGPSHEAGQVQREQDQPQSPQTDNNDNRRASTNSTSSNKGSYPVPKDVDELIARILQSLTKENTPNGRLAQCLNSTPENLFGGQTSDGQDPLALLDPTSYSLGYFYFLTHRALDTSNKAAAQNSLAHIAHFIAVCSVRQFAHNAVKVSRLGDALIHLAEKMQDFCAAIAPLRQAIARFTPAPHTLTSLHVALAQVCLRAAAPHYALPVLDQDVEILDTKTTDVTLKDYLLYFYYGGMVYMAVKNWKRAIEFLTLVISAPIENAVSAIQLEAYKKYILASLIHYGQVPVLPRYTSPIVERNCRSKHPAYLEIVTAFGQGVPQLRTALERHRSALEGDKHWGLGKQCLQALERAKIRELADVFVRASVQEVTAMLNESGCHLDETQVLHTLLDMCSNNVIQAKVSSEQSESGEWVKLVEFSEQEHKPLVDLSDRILETAELGRRAGDMDRVESLSTEFQTKYMALKFGGVPAMSYDEEAMDDYAQMFT